MTTDSPGTSSPSRNVISTAADRYVNSRTDHSSSVVSRSTRTVAALSRSASTRSASSIGVGGDIGSSPEKPLIPTQGWPEGHAKGSPEGHAKGWPGVREEVARRAQKARP
jgi:hypothetical protein